MEMQAVKQAKWLDADRVPSHAAMKGSIVQHLRDTFPDIACYQENEMCYCIAHMAMITLALELIVVAMQLTGIRNRPTGCKRFLISSVLSSNKDVVSLAPLHKMTAQDLCSMTQEVIKTVTTAGYDIVVILSDHNVISSKMSIVLPGTIYLKFY